MKDVLMVSMMLSSTLRRLVLKNSCYLLSKIDHMRYMSIVYAIPLCSENFQWTTVSWFFPLRFKGFST
ncbi:Uncharacterized protein TCM_002772 [Theobroma cacao]|uniref:Uncharacterized protein n=1 Tax=Theobroma cacao TaxID=3641 RepID=A0A061DP11_THECC|nr:Uncharacterized protein TCM_002772 [Theobroma cacao]